MVHSQGNRALGAELASRIGRLGEATAANQAAAAARPEAFRRCP